MMAKGSSYEREICYRLSDWWTGGQNRDDVIFWRTAGSGGRATSRFRKGMGTTQSHCGDITALGKLGSTLTKLAAIELKRGYNKATANDIIDRPARAKQQTLEGFFEQAIDSALHAKTPYWIIIHKRDKRQAIVYMPVDLFGRLVELGCFEKMPGMMIACPMIMSNKKVRFIHAAAVSFDDFLARVDPSDIKQVWRQVKV